MAEAFEQLVEQLQSWWPGRARRAAERLGELGDSRAIEPLARYLERTIADDDGREPVGDTRPAVTLQSLVRLGGVPAVAHLLPWTLLHPQPAVQEAAFAALAQLDDTLALRVALETLGNPLLADYRFDTREKLVRVLVRLGKSAAAPLVEGLRYHYEHSASYWGPRLLHPAGAPPDTDPIAFLADERAAPFILQALARRHPSAAVRVAEAWAEMGACTLGALERFLESPDRTLAALAALALARLQGPALAERFQEMLSRETPCARLAGAVGLAALGDVRPIETLIEALGDEREEVRLCAAERMAALGGAAVAALTVLRRRAGSDPHPELRSACHSAALAIERGLNQLPSELEAASPPAGHGTELEAAGTPPET